MLKYIRLLTAIVSLCICTGAGAQYINFKVDGISYSLYEDDSTCVVHEVDNGSDVVIPAYVRHNKKKYAVCDIEHGAFLCRSKLKSVTLPGTMNEFANELFNDFPSLVAINVDSQNADYASVDGVLYDKDKATLLRYPSGKPDSSFTIPQTVKAIGESAFANCINLENIVLPNQLREIGWWAFSGCNKLKSIRIPLSVESIGLSAFADCVSLTNIGIDAASPYFTCKDGVLYDKDMTAIVCYPAGRPEQTYTIPASVGEIDAVVFCGNQHLTNLMVDKNNPNYTSVEGVLYDKDLQVVVCCPSGKPMESLSFPKSVNKIGDFAFYRRQDSRVVIPDNIIDIGISAFGNSQNVTNLTIGKSIECATELVTLHNLKTIHVLCPSPPFFEDGVFFDEQVCRNAVLYVPESSLMTYKKDEYWSQFKNIKALEK